MRPIGAAFVVAALLLHGTAGADTAPAVPAAVVASPSPPAAETAPEAPPAAWIAPEDVVTRADGLQRLIDERKRNVAGPTLLRRIASELDAMVPEIQGSVAHANATIDGARSWLAIQDARRQLEDVSKNLKDWRDDLAPETKRLAESLAAMRSSEATWQSTRARPETVEAGDSVVHRVDKALASLRAIIDETDRQRAEALGLSDRLLDRSSAVDAARSRLNEFALDKGMHLAEPDRPPLWARGIGAALPADLEALPDQIRAVHRGTVDYILRDARPFLLQLFLALLLLFAFHGIPGRAAARLANMPVANETIRVLSRPWAIALLFALVATPWLHPSAPRRVTQALGLLAILPVIRIMGATRQPLTLPLSVGLLLLLLLDRVGIATVGLPALSVVVALAGTLTSFLWAVAYRRHCRRNGSGPVLIAVMNAAMALTGASMLAEVGGWSTLAMLCGRVALLAGITGLYVYAMTISATALLAYALAAPSLRRSTFFDRNQDLVQRWGATALEIGALCFWMQLIVGALSIETTVTEELAQLLSSKISVGELSISLGGTLSFLLTMLVAVGLSRIVHEVLEDEIFPRTDLPRGMPHALMALSRYTIWSGGFLLALGAAGVQFSQLAILLGGLGVGIGLGLQDVVKNFAAGITLLLERRVHVGDAVEIPDKNVFGRVLSIGMRASVVRNWNGAEVVLPNDDLVSGAVTNWTLSDRLHRIEVKVGVGYGSDPEGVLSLLLDAAGSVEGLRDKPGATAQFTGFGDSTLDFVLRAWIDDEYEAKADRTTALGLAVHRVLRDAGIEIPFPQRDVNLTSVTPQAAAALRTTPA